MQERMARANQMNAQASASQSNAVKAMSGTEGGV
jgi:hypothetical protein